MREHYIGMGYDLCMHWLGVDQCVFRPFQDQLLVGHSEGVSRYVFAVLEDFLVWLFLVLVKPTWIRWKSIFITHSTPSREERISFRSFSINCPQIPSSWIPILYSNVRISILCSSFLFLFYSCCATFCVWKEYKALLRIFLLVLFFQISFFSYLFKTDIFVGTVSQRRVLQETPTMKSQNVEKQEESTESVESEPNKCPVSINDLFFVTKTEPHIYYLPNMVVDV